MILVLGFVSVGLCSDLVWSLGRCGKEFAGSWSGLREFVKATFEWIIMLGLFLRGLVGLTKSC